MRAPLALLALLAAPLAAAHPDVSDHGAAFASLGGDGEPARLIEGCAFFVEGKVQGDAREGRLLILAADEVGGVRVVNESRWRADADGSFVVGPLDVGAGVFLAGVELDREHGVYSDAFQVDCMDPICPPEGCPLYRVSSTARVAPPSALALLGALAGVAALGALVVWRG